MKLDYRLVYSQHAQLLGCLSRPFDLGRLTFPCHALTRSFRHMSSESHHKTNSAAVIPPFTVPQLAAPDLAHAKQRHHVSRVFRHLRQDGILKINLGFPDTCSQYLENLVLSLHEYHGHRLPITHSSSRGCFWDIRPSITIPFQAREHQARSETMEQFAWHTDCSYEASPPRYFALHVLQHDRCGGGTLSVMNVQNLSESLSREARTSLMQQEYSIKIPPEFTKDPEKREIVGSVLTARHEGQPCIMRFRGDLITPLTERASRALQELNYSLQTTEANAQSLLHLSSADLPAGSIILLDNRRWLHERSIIKDPGRHLRRVRWDPVPF